MGIDAETAQKQYNGVLLKNRKLLIETVKEGFKHEEKKKKNKEYSILVKGISFKKDVIETEETLKKTFSNYGKIKNIRIPAEKDSKKHKGYAFIEFLNQNSATQAVKTMNGKIFEGQELHVSFKLDRDDYLAQKSKEENKEKVKKIEKKVENTEEPKKPLKLDLDSGEESDANDEELLKKFLGKLKPESKEEIEENYESEPEEEQDFETEPEEEKDLESEPEEKDLESDEPEKVKEPQKKKLSDPKKDLQQTIFLKGVPFHTTEKQIQLIFEKYGPVQYVALVKNKKTKEFNGTAFLKFKFLDGMKKCFEELEGSSRLLSLEKLKGKKNKFSKGDNEYHVMINDKQVSVFRAIEKEKAEKIKEQYKEKDDKRNLNLLKEGYIDPFSNEAKKIPAQLLKRIQQKYQTKKKKMRDPNNHISDTRVLVTNLHKNVTEKELKELFKEMTNNSKIAQIKILKDKEDNSHGFAFVQFYEHEEALAAVRKISNNVKLRGLLLMAEFAIDNARKLQKREFNIEKTKKLSVKKEDIHDKKRKRDETTLPRKKF